MGNARRDKALARAARARVIAYHLKSQYVDLSPSTVLFSFAYPTFFLFAPSLATQAAQWLYAATLALPREHLEHANQLKNHTA